MSFHAAQTFTFGEQPSATKWGYIWENDYALADGSGISSAAITPPKLSVIDRFRRVPALGYNSVIAGSWIAIGTSGTGSITGEAAAQSAGAQNEEVEYKCVLQAGTYKVLLHHDKDINRGIYTIYVDAASIGTVDGYAATRVAGAISSISTTLVVATNKEVVVRVKMATKNASSAGYYANFFELIFVKTA